MIRLLTKARQALLTDPVTHKPLEPVEIAAEGLGLLAACVMIAAILVLALGLGAGQ